MPTARRGITVVVPMYGDPESLRRCLTSLVEHVDTSLDRVLLVNDAGPEAEAIETAASELTGSLDGFRYERNAVNLGFVATCNRAALELDPSDRDVLLLNSDAEPTAGFLDELSAVLHESPAHGIVCPRSDNATIASLPHRLRDPDAARTPERTLTVHRALAADLPRYSYAPVAMGFCFLVRRELIAAHGLFDEAFSPGYGEENDFCLRMAALGYRSLIAHRALVFHHGSRSFSRSRRAKLRAAHEQLLVQRHPHYPAAVRDYLTRVADPVDVFADALAPHDDRPHILIEIDGDADAATPPGERMIVTAAHLAATAGQAVVTIAGASDEAHRDLEPTPGLRYARAGQHLGLFDLAVTWRSQATLAQGLRLNQGCLRWAIVDTGSAASWQERVRDPSRAAADEEALRFGEVFEPAATEAATRDLLLAVARRAVSVERLRERWWFYAHAGAHAVPGEAATSARRPHWLDRRAPRVAAIARRIRRWSRRG